VGRGGAKAVRIDAKGVLCIAEILRAVTNVGIFTLNELAQREIGGTEY